MISVYQLSRAQHLSVCLSNLLQNKLVALIKLWALLGAWEEIISISMLANNTPLKNLSPFVAFHHPSTMVEISWTQLFGQFGSGKSTSTFFFFFFQKEKKKKWRHLLNNNALIMGFDHSIDLDQTWKHIYNSN